MWKLVLNFSHTRVSLTRHLILFSLVSQVQNAFLGDSPRRICLRAKRHLRSVRMHACIHACLHARYELCRVSHYSVLPRSRPRRCGFVKQTHRPREYGARLRGRAHLRGNFGIKGERVARACENAPPPASAKFNNLAKYTLCGALSRMASWIAARRGALKGNDEHRELFLPPFLPLFAPHSLSPLLLQPLR